MTMYFRMFLHPDNTIPILIVGNVGAVLGAVVAHYTQAPAWVSLPTCLALIVVSPLLVTFYRQVMHGFSSEAVGRPAQNQLFNLLVRSVTAVADTMQGVLIGILRR